MVANLDWVWKFLHQNGLQVLMSPRPSQTTNSATSTTSETVGMVSPSFKIMLAHYFPTRCDYIRETLSFASGLHAKTRFSRST